ncbi:hypothetical protein J4206_01745 [Candidatus Woesearchaeota archaeon]|nr:hypothetical protein [Candidatus Woesearchaeota archaeon]
MAYEKIPIYGADGTTLEMDVAELRTAQQKGRLDDSFRVNLFHSIMETNRLVREEPSRREIKKRLAGTTLGDEFEVHTDDQITRYRASLEGLAWLYNELYKEIPPGFTG